MAMMEGPFSAATNPDMTGGQQMMPGMAPPGYQTPPMQPQQEEAMPDEGEQDTHNIDRALQGMNIAEQLRKKDKRKNTTELAKIGERVCKEYDIDEASRQDWMKRNEEWMKLATQVVEKKSFPWEGAANVKYPLLSMASVQFSARAYSSLIPSLDIVKAKVVGPDQDGSLTDIANTLSTHMSYQLLYEMDGWEEDLDILCFVLPIVGVMFKKTYYSEVHKKNVSELVHSKDLVVNYYTKSLKKSPRYTHIQYYTPNEIKERQLQEIFLEYDEDFGPGKGDDTTYSKNLVTGMSNMVNADDDDIPRKVLEQYRYLDLDDDGYKEPYIVTVDYETKQVLRITPNFMVDNVDRDEKGKILCITPTQWFTKFSFIPNPDGGFYDLGFGLLLGGINDTVNTLTNQLLDSGTLNNLNAGFIAKGLRVGGKDLKFRAGEWKVVNAVGDDLRKGILPLPSNPPSEVLFNLLGTLSQAGKELASVAEIFTGKLPGQNTPAATTMASIEQGLKVFTSIYKRIYRGLQEEFQKLYKLNCMYMPTDTTKFVSEVNGESKEYKVSRFSYQGVNVKIVPAADPNMVSETQKLMKIQGLQEMVQFGNVNPQEMTRQALVYQGQENIKALMSMPPPQPPLEIQLKQMELQDKEKDRQLEMMKLQSESRKRESEITLNIAKAKQLGDEQGAMMLEMQLEQEKATAEINAKWMDLLFKREEHKMNMEHKQQEHVMDSQLKAVETSNAMQLSDATTEQKIRQGVIMGEQKIAQNDAAHKQKMEQNDAMAKAKARQQKLAAKAKEQG